MQAKLADLFYPKVRVYSNTYAIKPLSRGKLVITSYTGFWGQIILPL